MFSTTQQPATNTATVLKTEPVPLKDFLGKPSDLKLPTGFKNIGNFQYEADGKHLQSRNYFIEVRKIPRLSGAAFKLQNTSSIPWDEKKRDAKSWFLKGSDHLPYVFNCLLSGEWNRLMDPKNPKTRIAIKLNEKKDAYSIVGILVEKVEDAQQLSFAKPTVINKRRLADAIVTSYVLGNADFKNENILVDQKSNVINIDGEVCYSFISTRSRRGSSSINSLDYTHVPEIYDTLPYLPLPAKEKNKPTFHPHNWYGVYGHSVSGDRTFWESAHCNYSSLVKDAEFIRGKNRTFLRNIMMPSTLTTRFYQHYLSDVSQEILMLDSVVAKKEISLTLQEIPSALINRLIQIKESLLVKPLFCHYLQCDEARNDFQEFVLNLKTFKTSKKMYLISSKDDETILNEMYIQFSELCRRAEMAYPHPLKNYLNRRNLTGTSTTDVLRNFSKTSSAVNTAATSLVSRPLSLSRRSSSTCQLPFSYTSSPAPAAERQVQHQLQSTLNLSKHY